MLRRLRMMVPIAIISGLLMAGNQASAATCAERRVDVYGPDGTLLAIGHSINDQAMLINLTSEEYPEVVVPVVINGESLPIYFCGTDYNGDTACEEEAMVPVHLIVQDLMPGEEWITIGTETFYVPASTFEGPVVVTIVP